MKIYFPANIYSALFGILLPDEFKNNIEIVPSALVAQKIVEDENSIGLVPSFDLIKYPNLKVSKDIAISFDGVLSNSYMYFVPEQNSFDRLLLRGDVASNEVILSKILFKERFDVDAEIILDTDEIDFGQNNYLISGQENNEFVVTNNGISFSDQVAEFIDYPYVNFVLTSLNEENILSVVGYMDQIDERIEDNILKLLQRVNISPQVSNYISENIDTVYFQMTENEVNGLHELLKLAYFHGIVDDIIEVKLV